MTAMLLKLFATTLTLAAAPANAESLKLWRLDCGTIAVNDLSIFSDTFGYRGQKKQLTDSCYLIQHGASYMLWDTGLPKALLGKAVSSDPMSPTLKVTLTDQLARLSVKPEQITIVGISHYHFDHTGQAAEFPKAKLMIGAADWEALRANPPPFGAEAALLAPWMQEGSPHEEVSGDRDVFGDGSVTMLSMPGHTPGSYALLVRLTRTAPVLLSGDVVHFEEQLANNYVPPSNTDRAETLASMDRLRTISTTLKATLVVQHDAGDISKLPPFPAAAE